MSASRRSDGARSGRSDRARSAGRATAPPGGRSGKAAAPVASPEAPSDDDPEAVARLICLRLLTSAPRTRAQLASALSRRGVPDAAAEALLGRFAEVGLIDDAMFARAWVESRHHGRGLARRALAFELNRRGVPREDIDAAVAQLSQETELSTARALVERRLASTQGQETRARIRRLTGMLARKGYPAGLAYRVVREALDQAGMKSGSSEIDAEINAQLDAELDAELDGAEDWPRPA